MLKSSGGEVVGGSFIKWAGGKSRLVGEVTDRISSVIGEGKFTYIEPFVGSGAVLFSVMRLYRDRVEGAVINDINSALVGTYRSIKYDTDGLISRLGELKGEYLGIGSEVERERFYYRKREIFNRMVGYGIEKSALMIFLNKVCFNGLYRENLKGEYNVPFGRHSNPGIYKEEVIRYDSELLQRVTILNGDYKDAIVEGVSGTVLYYFDPPYKPISKTSSFNSYTCNKFMDSEQLELKEHCDKLDSMGSYFILSNSDVRDEDMENGYFDDLYKGYRIDRVVMNRSINSKGDKRGKVSELLISNIKG